jgi:hypothetical protein
MLSKTIGSTSPTSVSLFSSNRPPQLLSYSNPFSFFLFRIVFDAPSLDAKYEGRVAWLRENIKVEKQTTYAAVVGIKKCQGKGDSLSFTSPSSLPPSFSHPTTFLQTTSRSFWMKSLTLEEKGKQKSKAGAKDEGGSLVRRRQRATDMRDSHNLLFLSSRSLSLSLVG